MRISLAVVTLSLAALATFGVTAVASAAPPGVSGTALNGAAEVPGPGDTDGRGTAYVQGRPAQSMVCVQVRYRNIEAPIGAHIHQGASTVAGPIVVDLSSLLASSPAGQINGCVATSSALARDIAQNPQGFYVNIHNTPFPGGAIRGQLAPLG